jgi:hypothetical protein
MLICTVCLLSMNVKNIAIPVTGRVALCTSRDLLPRNINFLLLVLISVKG